MSFLSRTYRTTLIYAQQFCVPVDFCPAIKLTAALKSGGDGLQPTNTIQTVLVILIETLHPALLKYARRIHSPCLSVNTAVYCKINNT